MEKPSLLRSMQAAPDKSEIEVFKDLTDQLTQLQHRFLRDQLLVAADIQHLRRSLVEKIPATA